MEVKGGDGTECGNVHGGGMVSPRLRRLLGRRDGCEYGCGTCSQGPLVHREHVQEPPEQCEQDPLAARHRKQQQGHHVLQGSSLCTCCRRGTT